jgi:ABC-type branched-subunit amino acid transport system ATPase component
LSGRWQVPQVLLLAAGMNPTEVRELVRRIVALGMTVLLDEHHMRFVMAIAGTVTVLSAGRIIAQGPPEVIQKEEGVPRLLFAKRWRLAW